MDWWNGKGQKEGRDEHNEGREGDGCLLSRLSVSVVVLDGQVLAAHHPVTLEPLASELLGCSLRCVGPFHGHTVVVGRVRSWVAGDGDVDAFLRVEHSVRRIHVQAGRVGRLEGEADALSSGVGDLQTG